MFLDKWNKMTSLMLSENMLKTWGGDDPIEILGRGKGVAPQTTSDDDNIPIGGSFPKGVDVFGPSAGIETCDIQKFWKQL